MGQYATLTDVDDLQNQIDAVKTQKRLESVSLNKEGKLEFIDGKGTKSVVNISAGPAGKDGVQGPPGPAGKDAVGGLSREGTDGIKFSQGWSGYPDAQRDGQWRSEISNDVGDFKQLMLVGNKSSGRRRVGIWDDLTVNGELNVTGEIKKNGQPFAGTMTNASSATIGGITISDKDVPGATQMWKADNGFYFYPGNGHTTRFRGPTVFEGPVKNDIGFGPYVVRFYQKNKCLDSGQFGDTVNGEHDCIADNPYQQWYYNPVNGQLRSVQNGKCLDRNNSNKWGLNDCNDHENQQFYKTEHLLRWKNENCLDTGNSNKNAGCDGGNRNQNLKFESNLSRGSG